MTHTFETPMLRQYREIKAAHSDAILFFRLGDFYEMFLDDAVIASRELELTLTGRGKDENRIPMCGVPFHAAETYIHRLVGRGYKVAICEQIEPAIPGKGLTRRDVVKIVTPGTAVPHDMLGSPDNRYIVSVCEAGPQFGVSFLDLSTGEFRVSLINLQQAEVHVARLNPVEAILPSIFEFKLHENVLINRVDMLTPDRAGGYIAQHFGVQSIVGLGLSEVQAALPAAWALLDYAQYTQKSSVPQIKSLQFHRFDDVMAMDRVTMLNLELVTNRESTSKQASLYGLLNYTKTAMGARKLKSVIQSPIYHIKRLEARLDAVGDLVADVLSREEIREILDQVYDIERLTTRIVSGLNHPRDCVALRDSFRALGTLKSVLPHLEARLLQRFSRYFNQFDDPSHIGFLIPDLIERVIVDQPPASIRDGDVIRSGYSTELDALKESFADVRDWIGRLEDVERTETGIKSLKVGYNKVFGYYIEVPHASSDKVPSHYIRKQTLANAERYITPDLKEKEAILLTGKDRQLALEYQVYEAMVATISGYTADLQELAQMIGELDCLQSLATASQRHGYTRPVFSDPNDRLVDIQNGRHPIVESQLGEHYVPNSIYMSQSQNRFILITGPNMAGKSTIMRQVALIIVMAQIGCFVPAERVCLSPVDRLFTRIGAMDNLFMGQSTFMVEMLETAAILANATSQSLIILDEIGRGTATFDGMSLACSISEYIEKEIQARTLFATHYHELTVLAQAYRTISNFTMGITELNGELVFTHQFLAGAADKSYGIHVAKMAGLPQSVITQAQVLLDGFEQEGIEFIKKKVL